MNSHEGDSSGIMYLDRVLLMDEYLYTRREQLDWIVAQHEQFRVEQVLIDDPAIAHAVYQTLLDAGHEGVMLKNRDSLYFSGKRCKNWLKIKPIMETLEIGRVGIGINDKQLSELTEFFSQYIISEDGKTFELKPPVVFEIAYDKSQKTLHYASRYARKLPWLVRERFDKTPEEADSVERVKQLVGG